MTSEEIRNANRAYLNAFDKWLQDKGLTSKTITRHVSNVDFYINYYLADYLGEEAMQGCYQVDSFLGDWFIRKAMWSSGSHTKASAASFKKFYACMLEKGFVAEDDYDFLCETIRDNMDKWLDAMRRYNDLDEEYFYDF